MTTITITERDLQLICALLDQRIAQLTQAAATMPAAVAAGSARELEEMERLGRKLRSRE